MTLKIRINEIRRNKRYSQAVKTQSIIVTSIESYCLRGELFVNHGICSPMFRDESRSIRHRMEEGPEGSITASVVIRVKDAGVNVYGDNLKVKRRRLRLKRG